MAQEDVEPPPPPPLDVDKIARRSTVRIRQPRCTIKVEPLLIIASLSGFPLMMLTQQYTFQQMAKMVAEEHGIVNYSSGALDTSEDPCSKNGPGNSTSPIANFTEIIQKRTSDLMTYGVIASAVPSLFAAIFLGAYSDKVGRKYAILPSLLACLCRTIVYVIIIELEMSVYYMLLGSFIYGLGGGYETLLMGSFAYVADITPPEKRSFRIVVAEFCMLVPAILAPAGVGVWIQKAGFLQPFLFVLIGQSLTALYALFLMPETIIPDGKARFFTTSHIKDTVTLYTKDNGTGRRWKLNVLLLAFFVFGIINLGMAQVNSLFMMNKPLCWGSDIMGYFSAAYTAVAIVGGLVVAKVLRWFFLDTTVCLIAGMAATLQQVYMGFVRMTDMMFVVPVFGCVGMLLVPNIRSVMSKRVLPTEQGAVFGSIASLEVICGVLGSVILNLVYTSTVEIYTGLVFWVMSIILALGCGILTALVVKVRHEQSHYAPLVETEVPSPTEGSTDGVQGQ